MPLLAPRGRSLESLWADTWAVGLFDWQLMVRGGWAHELGYASRPA